MPYFPTEILIYFVVIISSLIIASLIAYLLFSKKNQSQRFQFDLQKNQLHNEKQILINRLTDVEKDFEQTHHQKNELQNKLEQTYQENISLKENLAKYKIYAQQINQQNDTILQSQKKYDALSSEYEQVLIRAEKLETKIQEERQATEEKLALLHSARDELKLQFQHLANHIFEEKSKNFLDQNQQHLNLILNPLNEKMSTFSQLVQDTYEKEAKERLTLENELKRLQQLNTQLNQEAHSLTQALTGKNNKAQGNWGEMILEKILESSGLRKGIEYDIQVNLRSDQEDSNKRLQPDVIVHLPDNKHIIIDSKVSLKAYIDYTNSHSEEDKSITLKAHLTSVRQHIKDLAGKRYHELLPAEQSLDYVLMFMPIEPAYLLAMQEDHHLLQDSFAQNIILVCPSTLLAMLRTISGIWRFEQQNQNALKIANEAGKMLDKFNLFLDSLRKVGINIEQAQQSYQKAINQLKDGRGSLTSRAEKLMALGSRANKPIPDEFKSDYSLPQSNHTHESPHHE